MITEAINLAFASLETSEGFRAWLEDDPTKLVGVPGKGDECPIACYLEQVAGGEWIVSTSGIMFGWEKAIFSPTWVRELIKALDNEFAFSPVIARQVLTVLDRLKEDG